MLRVRIAVRHNISKDIARIHVRATFSRYSCVRLRASVTYTPATASMPPITICIVHCVMHRMPWHTKKLPECFESESMRQLNYRRWRRLAIRHSSKKVLNGWRVTRFSCHYIHMHSKTDVKFIYSVLLLEVSVAKHVTADAPVRKEPRFRYIHSRKQIHAFVRSRQIFLSK